MGSVKVFLRNYNGYFLIVGESASEGVVLGVIPVADVAVGTGGAGKIDGFKRIASQENIVEKASSCEILDYSGRYQFSAFPIA